MSQFQHPEMCETSFLLSENLCNFLYPELPTLVQGLSWVLLYSTRRHGFSLRTLYRRSTFCPGPCLLVARDAEGTILGGLLEAPLQPSTRKRYQGTNNTFVFTNVSGKPDIFRPTGANRYFILCMNDSLAIGGGGHFALYLDEDLLNGSSATSETFGNSCLAQTEDFVVTDVELWGFAQTSRYSSHPYREPQEALGISSVFA
ncbi:uncharacterized protein LOC131069594 isoform X2 [Cryptomeria japonica]|uniref:uncharacterized protein LOC131069594 isoform X2 n=1 Tax=Cryptomeria japonica TaxID=3369 RepID=UPI0025AD5676|nr:uncharacterized protein LOC131069594 isoform X2 [Cryptomeria japonica]